MGTKIHCESYLPIYPSRGDLKKDSCSGSLPLFYGDRTITNGQCYSGFMPRAMADGYPGLDMDVLKQKILEHEAVFKNQVCELHRLYRIQQDLMEEVRRKEHQCRVGESTEPSSSLSLQRSRSRVPLQGAQQWHMAGFPLFTSGHSRTSTSGVKVVNSPISSTKENDTQSGRFPFPNVSAPKEPYASELRPSKVRKKSFDLQLPAEEYIDPEEGEKLPETKVSNISSCTLNRNLKIGLQSNQKLSLEGSSSLETDCRTAASASASRLRNPTRLADLNEPVEIEEAIVPSSVVFLVRSPINEETKGVNQPSNPHAGYEYLERSGSSKSILSSTTHGFQQDQLPKPSKPMQSLTSRAEHPSGMYSTGNSRADLLSNGNGHCLESSDRSYNHSSNGHSVQGVSSQAPGSFPLFGSSLNGSWAHSVSSWANTNRCTMPKMPKMELPLNPSAPMNRALEDSSLSQEPSRGNWRPGDLMTVNGFSLGTASVLKEQKVHLPSSGVDRLNSKCNTVAPNCSNNHGFGNFPVGSCRVDSSSVLDIDLNEDVSMGSLDEAVIEQASTSIDGKSRPSLPWFSCKPSQANVAVHSKKSEPAGNASYHRASDNLCSMREVVRDLNRPCTPENKLSSSDSLIFEIGEVKKETLSHVSTSASDDCCPKEKNPIKERKNGIIDINLEYELDVAIFEEMTVTVREQKMGTSRREFIDLNSCVSDIEDSSVPSYESKTTGDKPALDIDLEAPILQEDDCGDDDNASLHENTEGKVSMQSLENEKEDLPNEVLGNAAEALVAISSSCPQIPKEDLALDQSETSLAKSLLWFVDALSANGFERPPRKKLRVMDFSKMDQFEAMTLQLPETKQADYLPNPFVPEVPENGANALTMSRRVQSRRGRQRRDFQRDILPGLVSLSRPEMTEDLQVFATLMRATGHNWSSGLTRRTGTRSGGARGRRRAVVENVPNTRACTPLANGIEACLEDRSLTGWGKTLRRPRRQRCHGAGNPPAPAVC